uniref:Collagen type XV alpha 1 chain n=1 Tax=Phasianus colchicus TaxID=9054 RepID=A0A669QFS9_PHACC
IDGMLEKVHLVTEGTLIYLRETSDVFIRVRNGWRKLQVLLHCVLSFPALLLKIELWIFLQGWRSMYGKLHLVALNLPFSGDMRADFQCFQQAQQAGLMTTYRAFLSSHLQDLVTVVRKADRYNLPIVNLKGETLFNNWESIFNGNGGQFNIHVPIYSFDGRNVMTDPFWPQKIIWHGSTTNGIRMVSNYCEAWHTADLAAMGQLSLLFTCIDFEYPRHYSNTS